MRERESERGGGWGGERSSFCPQTVKKPTVFDIVTNVCGRVQLLATQRCNSAGCGRSRI